MKNSLISQYPSFAFAYTGLDHADILRTAPAELEQCWQTASLLLLDSKGDIYADASGQIWVAETAPFNNKFLNAIFLGKDNNQIGWFALQQDDIIEDAPMRVDLRTATTTNDYELVSRFAYSKSMFYWQNNYQFCYRCGQRLVFIDAGFVGRCSECNTEHYPRVDHAIITTVSCENHILLGRQASWPAQRYSLIAGFVEPGETLEQAVAREVLEETGIIIRDCHYWGSQPWAFPSNMMVGFMATTDAMLPPTASSELEDARWFSLAEVRQAIHEESDWFNNTSEKEAQKQPITAIQDKNTLKLPPKLSISRVLIEAWCHSCLEENK